ncbi:polyketide synthase PksL [Methyloglobulus morosus KoM1]|uniref:Polyketide synthase PksL n=1 Tax=Methyloglobulus morosus KoM1 TaxID=1116472 RepID=V5DH19_9GAMM|nr:SDR family NAD(P)-dependent oxidoreductase [Methyloglobulus morosus]ESS66711.1 polyketide synthase PksL [Methyloglobulus morosus KoM1]
MLNKNIEFAIIGMACRFPGAENYHQYWENLVQAKNCITVIPNDRWDWEEHYGDPSTDGNKTNIKWGGFIKDIDKFDPLFFNISPKEAEYIDPQHRIFLETAWHSIEDAGYSVESLASKKIGVYAGVSKNDYSELMRELGNEIAPFISTGTVHSILANRLSFLFDFRGRSEAIDTACSSSLVALHNAMRDINNGECESALVGGVNALLAPTMFISHSKSGMLSINGQCKTFDSGANGYVRGEGVGVLFIKPLERAIAAGDNIHAVIKSSAVNHGGRANFLTSPTVDAQADVIRSALAKANIDPTTISYIEAHGTGTPLGDPIEINALKKAFKEKDGKYLKMSLNNSAYCALSSVKTNIGHLESASGIAGIIKAIMAMQQKMIPALRNFKQLNPYIDLDRSPFYIADRNIEWDALQYSDGEPVPRRVGVSSFGMGGVNAHIILEESPEKSQSKIENGEKVPQLILISSKKKESLKNQAENLISYMAKLDKNTENSLVSLKDIAYTLQVGRDQFSERLALIVRNKKELIEKLTDYIDDKEPIDGCFKGSVKIKKGETTQLLIVSPEMELTILSEKWVQGAKLDWADFYSNGLIPSRIPLPTYVFMKKRCWYKPAAVVSAKMGVNNSSFVAIPDKDPKTAETLFNKTLRPDDFYIKDHVVQGEKLLPGVAYLEFARDAYSKNVNCKTINTIRNIYWVSPLIVKDKDLSVNIKFSDSKTSADQSNSQIVSNFRIMQDNSLHSKGELGYFDLNKLDLTPIDIPAIKRRCRGYIQQRELYPLFLSNGLNYGSSFQAIQKCYYNNQESFSELILPDVIASSFDDYLLHPSLMDGVFQTIVALSLLGSNSRDQQYVPFYLESVEIIKPIPMHCYCYARSENSWNNDEIKFNAVICNKEGELLVKINGLTKRAINLHPGSNNQKTKTRTIPHKNTENNKADIYYRSEWQNSALLEESGSLDQLIVFSPDNKLQQNVEISNVKGAVYWVNPGSHYRLINRYQIEIDPGNPDDCLKIAGYLKGEEVNIKNILYLWNFDANKDSAIDPINFGVSAMLRLVKAIISKRAYKQIKLLYCYLSEVVNMMPYHALVGGFARTLAYENPNMKLYTMGIDTQNFDEIFRLALTEFTTDHGCKLQEISYRDGQRHERKIVNLSNEDFYSQATPTILRENGVYLITGGAGGLGYIFAKYLSEKYHATVLLIGRSTLNAQIADKVAAIQSYGGKCAYFSADITNSDEFKKVFSEIKNCYRDIHGVIHAAGIIEDAYILLKKEDSFSRVINTKVKGLLNLDSTMCDEELDFFCMFSSIAALMPNQGQSDYAAANSFLDSYAELRNQLTNERKRSGVSLSINWPLWAHGGMRVTPEEEAHLLAEFGMKPLEEDLGIDIFENGLKLADYYRNSNSLGHLVAIDGDNEKITKCLAIENQTRIMPPLNVNQIANKGLVMKNIVRKNVETAIKKKFSDLFDIPSEKIDGELRMSELGLDSNSMVSIVRHINDLYEIELKPTVFFEIDTINQFIDCVYEHCNERGATIMARHNTTLIDVDRSSLSDMQFQRIFNTSEFYLKDHVVEDQYNMPGACYIEMARQAGDLLFGDNSIVKLTNNYWARQLSSPDKDFIAYINVFRKGSAYEYEIVSYDDAQEKVIHAIGLMTCRENVGTYTAADRYFDLNAVRSRCPSVQLPDEVYGQIIAEGLRVGPTFMPMQKIVLNKGEALATLVLPNSVKDTLDDYVLHPTMLTGVFQTALISNRFDDENQNAHFIPMGIDELEIHAPVTDRCIVYSKCNKSNAELKKFDLLICREDGLIAVSLKGFAIRALKNKSTIENQKLQSFGHAKAVMGTNAQNLIEATHHYIKNLLSSHIGLSADEIDKEEPFEAYGINSVMIVELNKSFEDDFGSLSKTLFFEYRNTEELAEYFIENHAEKLKQILDLTNGTATSQSATHDTKIQSELNEPKNIGQGIEKNQSVLIGRSASSPRGAENITGIQILKETQKYIKQLLSSHIGLTTDEIEVDDDFEAYGINSMMIVELNKSFEDDFGSLSKTLFFEYRNVQELAEYFIENHIDKLYGLFNINGHVAPTESFKEPVDSERAVKHGATDGLRTNNQEKPYVEQNKAQPKHYVENDIAIIGVDGRYPGANNINEFWEMLKRGVDSVTEMPESRFDYSQLFDADPEQHKIYSKRGAFINDIDKFDAAFFNISPREAELIDPQERLFLEVAWGTFEDAGYTRQTLLNSSDRQVGVFVGALWQPYQSIGTEETLKGNIVAPSGLLYSIANRVSYFMNFSGPSLAIDSACSSSLTAVHLACQSLNSGDCKLALAGGVNLSAHSSKYLFLSQNHFLSTDGLCRSFGDGGDGYVPGEGVGAILLKPLSEAIKDGDQIYGVIKGSSINHGGKTNGYTVPCPKAQGNMIKHVYEKAGINPRTISYIEAHGTGTPLGDPIEITGLQRAFEVSTKDKQFCAIGSVKSNIGHLEAAAGIASITKVILQMKHKKLVPSIHSDTLNQNIDFEKTPFKVQRELSQWQQPNLTIDGLSQSFPRRAGISSFGAGGSNAHILLEEFMGDNSGSGYPEADGNFMILLSAKNEERLRMAAENLLNFLDQGYLAGPLNDLAYTLQAGREAMTERLGILVNSSEELQSKLKAYLNNDKKIAHLYSGNVEKSKTALAVFQEDDEDMSSLIQAWTDKGKYYKLLDIWVKGFSIDWNTLYGKSHPHRISVPVYPFAKERFWIPQKVNQDIAIKAVSNSALHPLVHENNSSFTQQRFSSIFTGAEFFLNDHIVGNQKVLPAVAYIEMFRAATSLSNDKFEPYKLFNLTWLKPIVIEDEPKKIWVELSMEDDEYYFQASMEANGQHAIYAQGQCIYLDANEAKNRLEHNKRLLIDEIAKDFEQQTSSDQVYDLFHRKGLNLQKAFQGVNWIKFNENNALGEIHLPSFLNSNARKEFTIHPCLLDSALQTALYVLESEHQKEGALFLPFSIEEIEIFSALPDTFYSFVKPCDKKTMTYSHQPVRSFDVTLVDSDGNILLAVKNISFRETNLSSGHIQNITTPSQAFDLSYYSPAWVEEVIEVKGKDEMLGTGIVVVSNNDERLEQFSEKLLRLNGAVPVLKVALGNGIDHQQASGKIYINSLDAQGYSRLGGFLDEKKIDVSHIVYLWDSTHQATMLELPEQTQQALTLLFHVDKSLLHATKTLKQLFVNLCEPNTAQWVIEGSITGFLQSIGTEYPKTTHKVVSIEAKEIERVAWQDNALKELLYSFEEKNTWVQYGQDSDSRLIWRLHALDGIDNTLFTRFHLSALKQGGTYLITGGMGGIAKILASYLVQNYRVNLILLGRSALQSEGESFIQDLKSSSTTSDIAYLEVDIGNLDRLGQAFADAKQRFGTLNGVFHSAGVLEDNLLANKAIDSLQKVLRPKLQGTVNLDQVTQSEQLDFFLVFSSLTAILGNPGQCDYGAANGFMDAFIAHRKKLVEQQARYGSSLTINWPFWNEGQMGQDNDVLSLLDDSFGLPLDKVEAFGCLEEALHFGGSQIAVIKKEKEFSKPSIKQKNVSKVPERSTINITVDQIISRLSIDTRRLVAELGKFKPEQISTQSDFMALGFESVVLAKLANMLNKKYALKISPAVFFEHTNLEKLNAYLLDEHRQKMGIFYENLLISETTQQENAIPKSSIGKRGYDSEVEKKPSSIELEKSIPNADQTTEIENETMARADYQKPIENRVSQDLDESGFAVIGMDCLFPGAPDLDSFWKLLVNCESAVSDVPEDRWDWKSYYGDPSTETNKTNIKWGCFVDDLDKFDASFFNISPREAALMDPQQRILLQSVWKAIEHAGYAPTELSKNHKVGVFIGTSGNDYYELLMNSDVEAYSATGGVHSISANRISYYFDFKGPSIAVDTACSSSLVALDMAIQSLNQGGCEVAIAGGVNALISPNLYISFSKAGMLSPDGNISPLDKKANGYVRGEGVGILVLKRLDKAIKDQDEILAVIKGTSVNHGGKVPSLTVPNPKAQAELVLDACNKANVDISTLNYIEMHGTGTPLGDPIEVNGLKSAFKQGQSIQQENYCGIASVKGNIGHLEAAAGVAGMIKTILALKNKTLPGQCHFEELNPHIQLEGTPFKVVQGTQHWHQLSDSNGTILPRRAGVSSFGFGGANSHVVIEEYVDTAGSETVITDLYGRGLDEKPYLIVLSAKTGERLKSLAREFVDYLGHSEKDSIDLERIAYTLQIGRSAMGQRLGFLVKTREELQQKLKAFVNDEKNIDGLYVRRFEDNSNKLVNILSDEEDVIVNSWIVNENFDHLLEYWVIGGSVDWSKLYDKKPQRTSLPTYPFTKERYWIANDRIVKSENNSVDSASVHLPLGRINASDFTGHDGDETLKADTLPMSEQQISSVDTASTYLRTKSKNYFKKLAASILHMPEDKIDSSRSLEEYGMDSILVMQVINTLNKYFSDINSTLLLNYRTIDAITEYFLEYQRDSVLRLIQSEAEIFGQTRIRTESALPGFEFKPKHSQNPLSHENDIDWFDKPMLSINEVASAVFDNKVNFKDALRIVRQGKTEFLR